MSWAGRDGWKKIRHWAKTLPKRSVSINNALLSLTVVETNLLSYLISRIRGESIGDVGGGVKGNQGILAVGGEWVEGTRERESEAKPLVPY